VSTLEIVDKIHELIFEDRRISAKSTADQLGISRERFGFIFYEHLGILKLSILWARNA
jgi:AraC-like DNA-binding protein